MVENQISVPFGVTGSNPLVAFSSTEQAVLWQQVHIQCSAYHNLNTTSDFLLMKMA